MTLLSIFTCPEGVAIISRNPNWFQVVLTFEWKECYYQTAFNCRKGEELFTKNKGE